jgi:hypothetical protein
MFDQAIYNYLISFRIESNFRIELSKQLYNSTRVLKFNISIRLDSNSKKFQFDSTLFESRTRLELEFPTRRDQSRTIKMYYKICDFIEVILKSVCNIKNNQLVKLQRRAYDFKKSEIHYYINKLIEKTESLDTIHTKVQVFKEQAKKLICSLAQFLSFIYIY